MSRCPTCKTALDEDRIGQPGQTRLVLFCHPCRCVFPFDQRPIIRLVESRADLA